MTSCTSCGGENADGARFCVKCGATLAGVAPSPGSWQAPSGDLYSTPSGNINSNPYGGAADYSAPSYGSSSYGSATAGAYSAPQQQPSAYPPPSQGANPYAQPPSQALGYAQPQAPWMAPAAGQAGMRADPGMRLVGYLIDIVPWFVIMLIFTLIPFVGWIFGILLVPILTVAYILLRDIQGASLGKQALGMKVMGKDGREATNGARILRNLPLAVPSMFMIIPIIGHIIGAFVGLIIGITEIVSIFSSGERIGDKLANTVVVKTR